jgi:hypothetical protein
MVLERRSETSVKRGLNLSAKARPAFGSKEAAAETTFRAQLAIFEKSLDGEKNPALHVVATPH